MRYFPLPGSHLTFSSIKDIFRDARATRCTVYSFRNSSYSDEGREHAQTRHCVYIENAFMVWQRADKEPHKTNGAP